MDEQQLEQARERVEERLSKRTEFVSHLIAYIGINAVLWFVWSSGVTFGWDFPWVAVGSALWGAGLIAHAVETFLKTNARPEIVDQKLDEQLVRQYGEDWEYEVDSQSYQYYWDKVAKRINERGEFFQHLGIFIMVIGLAWALWGTGTFYNDSGLPWPAQVMMLWGVGLTVHAVKVYMQPSEERILQEVERELETTRKRKSGRKRALQAESRLADDSELIAYDEWDDTTEQGRRA